MCKSYPRGAGFEGIECYGKQLSHGWARGQEVPGEGAASVAVEDPGLKGSCRELRIKSWHHEEISGEAVGKSAVAFWRCQYQGKTTRNSRSQGMEPTLAWRTSCGMQEEPEQWHAFGGSQKILTGSKTSEGFAYLELGFALFRL